MGASVSQPMILLTYQLKYNIPALQAPCRTRKPQNTLGKIETVYPRAICYGATFRVLTRGEVLTYIGYIDMCLPIGYGF